MPRGRRKTVMTIADQIAQIDQQIADLQTKKSELVNMQEQEAVQQLLNAAKAAGKSPMELVAELTKQNS